jgi:hypothetical protein
MKAPGSVMTEKAVRTALSRRLKELRETKLHGISIQAVAALAEERKLKIGYRTIYDYERPDSCNPTLDKLLILATLYDTTLGELFAFTNPRADSGLIVGLMTLAKDEEVRSAIAVLLDRLRVKA